MRSMTGKQKRMIRKLLRRFRHTFVFPIAFLYFEIMLRVLGGTGLFKGFFYMLFFSVGFGFFASVITSLFPRHINRKISIGILFITGVLFLIECFIKEGFNTYMTFGAVLKGAGGVMTGYASELFRTIFGGIPVMLLFLLPGILYTVLGAKRLPAKKLPIPYTVLALLCAVIVTGIGVLTAANLGSRDKYKSQFEFNTATETFGLLNSMRLSGKYTLFGNKAAEQIVVETANQKSKTKKKEKKIDYGENVSDIDFASLAKEEKDETIKSMHTYVDSLTPTNKNAYTGLFKDKNLILITAEAFSDCVISKELTPTLYRMTHKGFYFSEYYQPSWGGSTITGEYSFLTGLVPMHEVETIPMTADNLNYYTLGNRLKKNGYYSSAYHNGTYDYYDRHKTHKSFGYDEWIGQGNGLEDIAGAYVKDSVMFDKTMDTYMDKQPFSIYYMTVSGHCTYRKSKGLVKENLERVKEVLGDKGFKDTTLYYYCYQLELEKAMKVMIEKLEAAGIADDTVICLTSDHYPYGLEKSKTFGNSEDYVSDLYGYKYKNGWEKDHNSWILWSGCLENEQKDMAKEISSPTYSLDIVPTLLNLFGIEYDSRLLVGRDVFSDAEPLALWNNQTWVTDKGRYDAATDEFTPREGVVVEEDYVKTIKNEVANKIKFSNQVLEQDYYKILFKSY